MSHDTAPQDLPGKPSLIAPLLRPLHAFLSAEYVGGLVLLAATVAALVWANSPWSGSYHDVWHAELSIGIGGVRHAMSLAHWVNDGLMVVFFLLVGLEIKREILIGELASIRSAVLPVVAALGGMVVPALIYAGFNLGGPGSHGWGVPMATDIAFAVGVLALLGRGIPVSVKVFLLAVAIVDDLGAVLVIALFYTSGISLPALGAAGLFLAALAGLNLARVHRPLPYLLLGAGLWLATLASGIHATIAGVLLAFAIPATRQLEEADFIRYAASQIDMFRRDARIEPDAITDDQSHALKAIEEASQAVQTPLARVEHALLLPVTFAIVPLFALANAGVDIRSAGLAAFEDPVAWGVLCGLLLGKPVGILLFSWLALKTGLASLPAGATRRQMIGVAILCGIGFTMSLFVANLAFPGRPELLDAAKIGILGGSLLAGILGGFLLATGGRRVEASRSSED